MNVKILKFYSPKRIIVRPLQWEDEFALLRNAMENFYGNNENTFLENKVTSEGSSVRFVLSTKNYPCFNFMHIFTPVSLWTNSGGELP